MRLFAILVELLRKTIFAVLFLWCALASNPANAQGSVSSSYSFDELLNHGHGFFGSVSEGLASVLENAISQFGLPNGYILGQEASGAIFGGVRYGEGSLYTRNAGEHVVYWQGPTLGLDFGGDGSRTMMLVYNLPSVESLFERYPGVDGQAYLVGGLGMTVMKRGDVVIVPIRSGVGARLGLNIGYLKFTRNPDWNPF